MKLIIDFEHRLKRLYYTETKEREYNSSDRCARSQLTRGGGICGCLLGFILSLATHHLYYKYVSFSMLKAVRANRIYTTSATKLKPYQAKKIFICESYFLSCTSSSKYVQALSIIFLAILPSLLVVTRSTRLPKIA